MHVDISRSYGQWWTDCPICKKIKRYKKLKTGDKVTIVWGCGGSPEIKEITGVTKEMLDGVKL